MKKIYTGIVLLACLLFIASIFDLFFIEIAVIILIGALAIWSQYERLINLRIHQMIFIGIFVVGIVLGTATLFYYVYRPLVDYITIGWLREISIWILMIVSLIAVSYLTNTGVKKLATPKSK